jgi:hypothetical protein
MKASIMVCGIRMAARLAWLVALSAVIWLLGTIGVEQYQHRYADHYLRVQVSSDTPLWLHFKGERVRTASSAEALETAEWREWLELAPDADDGPTVCVNSPMPAQPADPWIVIDRHGSRFSVQWIAEAVDSQGVDWAYRFETLLIGGGRPDSTPVVRLPEIEKTALWLDVEPRRETGGPAIAITAGLSCSDSWTAYVLRRGKQPDLRIEVLDARGATVTSETASLDEMGYG